MNWEKLINTITQNNPKDLDANWIMTQAWASASNVVIRSMLLIWAIQNKPEMVKYFKNDTNRTIKKIAQIYEATEQ